MNNEPSMIKIVLMAAVTVGLIYLAMWLAMAIF
jgi:hypothetical protein